MVTRCYMHSQQSLLHIPRSMASDGRILRDGRIGSSDDFDKFAPYSLPRGVYAGGKGSSCFQAELEGDKIPPSSSLNSSWIK